MNNEQQQIIDEAYKNYVNWWEYDDNSVNLSDKESEKWLKLVDGGLQWGVLSKEEFINKCKTNPEFSEKWGLKIEERELNHDERINLCLHLRPETKFAAHYETNETLMNDWNIPTRLITVTRELSESEIWDYIHKNKIEILHQHAVLYGHEVGSEYRKSFIPTLKENYNIPTNKTIESYE